MSARLEAVLSLMSWNRMMVPLLSGHRALGPQGVRFRHYVATRHYFAKNAGRLNTATA